MQHSAGTKQTIRGFAMLPAENTLIAFPRANESYGFSHLLANPPGHTPFPGSEWQGRPFPGYNLR